MAGRPRTTTEVRFWSLVNGPWVDERLDPYESCWQWMGALIKSRPPKMKIKKPWRKYGRFHWPLPEIPKYLINAHRAALLLTVGPPPDGDELSTDFVAGHRCDNSLCVHPGHLCWQTQQQNIADAVERNRLSRGPNGQWITTGAYA